MEMFFRIANPILEFAFFVCYVIFFYCSIKKCFQRVGVSKSNLFVLTFFTNPMVVFFVLGMLIIIVEFFVLILGYGYDVNTVADMYRNVSKLPLATGLATNIIFTLLLILFSRVIGKWLKANNVSLVVFIYLMFGVIIALSGGRSMGLNSEYKDFSFRLLDFVCKSAFLVTVFLMYHFLIKALAELTKQKHRIRWMTFVIPPIAFLLFYSVFDVLTFYSLSYDANVVVQISALVILLLFIWAFYVIINNIRATDEALTAKDEVKELSVEVMEALAHTIDAKDAYTNGHSVRVAKYSRMIAEKMGLSAEFCENIYYMGLLHDIGKIGVPNEIINKPGRLTDDEYDVIKTHPEIGYQILSEIKSNRELAKGARWHHERYDGKGYPDRKAGEVIPLEARIIAVADSYDAMTSNRSYRSYLPQDVVRSEIENNMGTQFDPEAAKCMLAIMDEDKEYRLHEHSDNIVENSNGM